MSISITSNGNAVAAELGNISGRHYRAIRSVVDQSGIDVREAWQDNARETAGPHGKWYPSSIRSRMTGPLESTIEPREDMKQGAMSFEFGSRNQPPHLDGQRALDALAPLIRRRIEAALTF